MSRDGGEDGWTSEYDSTWEDEKDGSKRTREPRKQRPNSYSRRWRNRPDRDLQRYRRGYRGESSSDQSCMGENCKPTPNLDFYQNKKCFEPGGLCIEDLLNEWKEDYNTLERNHSYIQWLFPLREYGMNTYAKPLTLNEIKMMKEDKAVMTRFLKAYKLMLQFYGIKLLSEETGEVARAGNWEDRFKNLNYHGHNNLRITRILKCLGEIGYEHFQAPLVQFFLEETLMKDKLSSVKRSVLDYFMFAVKDKHERKKLVHFAWKNYKPNNHQDRFIWGPVDKLQNFNPWEENDVKENASSEGLPDDVKSKDSKMGKNPGKGQQFINVHESGRARDDEVTPSQHDTKMEKDNVRELIPLNDRGALPDNSPNHETEAGPDQSTALSNVSHSIVGLGEEEEEEEEKNHDKKEENLDSEDAKEDPSKENLTKKVHKEEVLKKTEHDLEEGLEVNGLSNQNVENKNNQGEHHRKRKVPDSSPMSPPTDGCPAGDGTKSGVNASPGRTEDEGGQVDRVEVEVKKLKLVERQTTDCLNGLEEADDPDDSVPGDVADNPNIGCNLQEHSQDHHTDE
ncbi:uncharacterized protein LOC142665510 [Rhinoderma darwinii]|uniref:uncharacterized protein LOC142665510 n=1 Tax=Rhinoderma darwinii TaxID=43563 RepID=UPI003F67AFC3